MAAALRALLAGTRSGRLVLGTTAELLFRDGKVVSAQVRALQGERAFRRMLFLGEGAYAVHLGGVRNPGELSVDLRALCGPWTEELGGWRALARVSVPLEAVLCPDLRSLLAQSPSCPRRWSRWCACSMASAPCAPSCSSPRCPSRSFCR